MQCNAMQHRAAMKAVTPGATKVQCEGRREKVERTAHQVDGGRQHAAHTGGRAGAVKQHSIPQWSKEQGLQDHDNTRCLPSCLRVPQQGCGWLGAVSTSATGIMLQDVLRMAHETQQKPLAGSQQPLTSHQKNIKCKAAGRRLLHSANIIMGAGVERHANVATSL